MEPLDNNQGGNNACSVNMSGLQGAGRDMFWRKWILHWMLEQGLQEDFYRDGVIQNRTGGS